MDSRYNNNSVSKCLKQYDFPTINNYKEMLNKQPTVVDIDNFDEKCCGYMIISHTGTKFETFFLQHHIKKLYCYISNAPGKYPNFSRVSWGVAKNSGMVLCIDDPSRKEIFFPAYFVGNRNEWYINKLLDIIRKIILIYDIDQQDIYFIGSSNAGFVSIQCCNKILGSNCISINGQIDASKWLKHYKDNNNDVAFQKISGIEIKSDLYKERFNVIDFTENKISHFFLYFNKKSYRDKEQLDILLDKLNISSFNGIIKVDNITILCLDVDSNIDPHLVFLNYWATEMAEIVVKEKTITAKDKIFWQQTKINMSLTEKLNTK